MLALTLYQFLPVLHLSGTAWKANSRLGHSVSMNEPMSSFVCIKECHICDSKNGHRNVLHDLTETRDFFKIPKTNSRCPIFIKKSSNKTVRCDEIRMSRYELRIAFLT